MRVLVTGASSFSGSYLIPLLLERGDQVYAGDETVRTRQVKNLPQGTLHLIPFDLLDERSIEEAVEETSPDAILHLAAVTFLPSAETSPIRTLDTNTRGTLVLAEALFKRNKDAVFIYISSGDIYGRGDAANLPFTEESSIRPMNIYSASKVSSEFFLRVLSETQGRDIRIARPFNYTGAGQRDIFVCSDFSHQIALIEKGRKEPLLLTGDLTPQRDFSDVRDIVKGYVSILEKGEKGEIYNLCSGKPVRIGEVLEILKSLSKREFQVRIRQERLRKSDNPVIYGSFQKAREKLGWEPTIPLKETLSSILEYWRERT